MPYLVYAFSNWTGRSASDLSNYVTQEVKMKLSDGEKLILAMLGDIYEHFEIEGNINHKLVNEAISSENTWGLAWEFQGIPFEDKEAPPIVNEVCNILDMWWLLETAYKKLSPEEKVRIENEVGILGKNVKFPGFDANNERHYGIAQFLIKDLKRFDHFKDHYLNSHSELVDSYQRMLEVFSPIRNSLIDADLSADQIIEILKERIHPDRR